MMKLRVLLGVCVVAGLAGIGASAGAAGAAATTCTGGTIAPGTYQNVTVTGACTFGAGVVTINGNLVVAPGAILNDHAGSPAYVHVRGNATVGAGGVLGLGTYPMGPSNHDSSLVDGNVVANGAASLYLGGMTVRGNVVVNGGGDPTRNLPIKDDTIGGNLVVQGWSGLWFGVVRDVVRGNVVLTNNVAANPGEDPGADSTEVVTNTISGNLVCTGNVPAAQIGDSGGSPNVVRGNEVGQCAGL